MGDPVVCCILGICCPPAKQEDAYAEYLIAEGVSKADAKKAAKATLERFDLAEKGTLQPLKDSFTRLAKG